MWFMDRRLNFTVFSAMNVGRRLNFVRLIGCKYCSAGA